MSDTLRCGDCGEEVTLGPDDEHTLWVSCDCMYRSVKVAKVLPERWSA